MDNPFFYTTINNTQTRDNEEFLEEVKNDIFQSAGESVLDIGCGPGNFTTTSLAKLIPESHIVGADISAEMIKYASDTYGSDKFTFKVMDIESTNIWEDWKKNSFNQIYSFFCLHWVQNQREAMKNIYSLAKPGGYIFLILVGSHPIYRTYEILTKCEKWQHYLKDYWKYEPPYCNSLQPTKDLENLLKDKNFVNVQVKIKIKLFIYKSRQSLIDFMKGWSPFLKKIPESERTEHLQNLFDTLVTCNSDSIQVLPNGQIECIYTMLHATAKKPL